MIKKLRQKFVWINMIIVTVMLVIIFTLVLTTTKNELEYQSRQTIHAIMEGTVRPGPKIGPAVQLPYFTVRAEDGGMLLAGNGYYDFEDEEFLTAVMTQVLSREEKSGILEDYALRYSRETTPRGEVFVFVDMSGERSTLASLVKNSVLIGALSFGLFFVISLFLARWAVKPVENAWNQQRQFVADASHELKTPLTVIMTNTELLQGEYPEEEKRQFVKSIQVMSRQMRGLVERLLELARVDNGTARLEFTALDWSQLVTEGLLPFEPVYFEQGLTLDSRIGENLQVLGSAAQLRQVLDVLLDNACKYARPESTVRVGLTAQGKNALLLVANQGQAMSQEELKNIFKRFYRTDKARAMDGSYGLGLAIAQSIVNQHGGRIWARSDGGWNTFFVQLPLRG